MRIDCRDLACPEPVLRTKKALEELPEDAILEVEVNSVSSVGNVKRFAGTQGYECREEKLPDGATLLTIVKGYLCELPAAEGEEKSSSNKTLFIKHDRIGEGELGDTLMLGFLKTTLELDTLPRNIILVNRGVFLTTDTEGHGEVIEVLRRLEERGVKIYSCGLCMNHYGIDPGRLEVGEIGNAYDTMVMLMQTETVTL